VWQVDVTCGVVAQCPATGTTTEFERLAKNHSSMCTMDNGGKIEVPQIALDAAVVVCSLSWQLAVDDWISVMQHIMTHRIYSHRMHIFCAFSRYH
jgi:hypothetical protein